MARGVYFQNAEPMPTDLPFHWTRRFPRLRPSYLIALVVFVVVGIIVFGRYERQIGAFIATPTDAIFSNKTDAKLPTVVKLGNEQRPATPAPSAPSNLPTVIKLGTNAPPTTGAIQPNSVQVIDGDTIRVNGHSYRLVGIDAPESGPRAKCAAERDKAARATRRLREIVEGGALRLERVSCNCAPGTEGTESCNYGRYCVLLTAVGRDIGQMLISEGLAKRYDCSAGHCPPKQSWCS
jgi:endonuclease YncB( thermonuclease family)